MERYVTRMIKTAGPASYKIFDTIEDKFVPKSEKVSRTLANQAADRMNQAYAEAMSRKVIS